MAHSPVRNELVNLANTNAGDPMGFLEGLSDIHVEWHREDFRTYGFLLFHHRVVQSFTAIVNNRLQNPVSAFTEDEFDQMGAQPYGGNVPTVDTLAELATFSISIESWHNGAHGDIGRATGVPMMDASQNIFFRAFWQLHLYIDELFQVVLSQYGDTAHPGQFLAPSAVASHLETVHHNWVPRI